MNTPIYLDYNATTPVDPAVLDAMLPYFRQHFGNASSSTHPFGWVTQEAVDVAREQVAALIEAEPRELVFTSGATEAINLALKGVAEAYASKGRHIVTVQTEHKAVLDTCAALERQGVSVTYLPVAPDGLVDPEMLAGAITDETILVSVMWANNETGTIQPVRTLAEVAHEKGALFMTDATQAVGKLPVSVDDVDLLACSAHKFYGPKGVGALYVRRRRPRVRLVSVLDGGGQERGLRGGTLNTPGIVGMGAAAELAGRHRAAEAERLGRLRDRLEQALRKQVTGVQVNGHPTERLPHTSNLAVRGVKSADLLLAARALAISTGSACSSASGKPSHVLKALGLSDEAAYASIRISLGRFTTDEDIEYAIETLTSAITRLRREAVTVSA